MKIKFNISADSDGGSSDSHGAFFRVFLLIQVGLLISMGSIVLFAQQRLSQAFAQMHQPPPAITRFVVSVPANVWMIIYGILLIVVVAKEFLIRNPRVLTLVNWISTLVFVGMIVMWVSALLIGYYSFALSQ